MSYRDMTFCCASCSTTVCFRHLSNVPPACTEPIAQTDFSHDCPMFRPAERAADREGGK